MAYLTNTVSRISTRDERQLNAHLTFLREEMGVMQHHDAVTGTEKQHVASDYMRNLFIGIKACNYNVKVILNAMTQPTSDQYEPNTEEKRKARYVDHAFKDQTNQNFTFDFASCQLLNISECEISEFSEKFMVTVYNPLAHSTFQFVRFPVPTSDIRIMDYRKVPVQFQVIPITGSISNLPFRNSSSKFEVIFMAQEVPGLGFKNFFVERIPAEVVQDEAEVQEPEVILMQRDTATRVTEWQQQPKEDKIVIGNKDVQLTFDSKSAMLEQITVEGKSHKLEQEFLFYKGASGTNYNYAQRSSGAYIFRPNGTETTLSKNVQISVVRGDIVDEVHQVFNEWISQIVRIYHDNTSAVEFEWMVGPIPIKDVVGKEVVTRFTSEIMSKGIFYTDSNGREMIKRVRNSKPLYNDELVAINYYPITTKISLEDSEYRMSIITDRAQGGSSLVDGALDIMVHRRLLRDDAFGVGEALNEAQFGSGLIARGKHHLVFGSMSKSTPTVPAIERFVQNQKLMANWFFFSKIQDLSYANWLSRYRHIV